MATDARRNGPRVDSLNLLYYTCRDEDDNETTQGMGKTLNVSENGILLETHAPIDPKFSVSLTIALGDNLMDFRGNSVRSREREDGLFEHGIEFAEMDDERRLFLKQYMVLLADTEDED